MQANNQFHTSLYSQIDISGVMPCSFQEMLGLGQFRYGVRFKNRLTRSSRAGEA